MDKKFKKERKVAYFYLICFALLIAGGIIAKRVYGHPEQMMLWHLPAAIFLILAGKLMTKSTRERYYQRKLLDKVRGPKQNRTDVSRIENSKFSRREA